MAPRPRTRSPSSSSAESSSPPPSSDEDSPPPRRRADRSDDRRRRPSDSDAKYSSRRRRSYSPDDDDDRGDDGGYDPPSRRRGSDSRRGDRRSRSRSRPRSPESRESSEGRSGDLTTDSDGPPPRDSGGRSRRDDRDRRRSGGGRRGPRRGDDEEKLIGRRRGSDSDDSDSDGKDDEPPPPSKTPVLMYVGIAIVVLLILLGGFYIYEHGTTSGTTSTSTLSSSQPTVAASTSPDAGTSPVETSPAASTSNPPTSAASPTSSSPPAKTSSTSGSGSGNGTTSTVSGNVTLPGVSKNGIGIGFLPDYDDQTMVKINSGLSIKSSFYGWYAQLPESGNWDGSQLTSQMADLKASGAIFQPAVMPTNGWAGLTPSDNYQALAIAKVLQQFTSQGIEVWLRFAHEVNYYQTDGTYQGTAADFKAGWAAVAAAVKGTGVKMWFTPNIATLSQYQSYFPDDPSTVDIIGIDYYPDAGSDETTWLAAMQPFYNAYCKNSSHSILFAIGETGLKTNGTSAQKLTWLSGQTSTNVKTQMPNMVGVSWFNYMKGVDFRIFDPDTPTDTTTEATKTWMATGTVASGVVV